MSVQSRGLGTVSPGMVEKRAREIALVNGRPEQVTEEDLEQARRELLGLKQTSEVEEDVQSEFEAGQWDPVPGTAGHRREPEAARDEQTFAERLVEEGIDDAEHELMVEGERAALRRERGSEPRSKRQQKT